MPTFYSIPCLRKPVFPWNISQYNYNQDCYKGEKQNCVYWPIIGSYKNWRIIYFIDNRKHHKSTDIEITVNIKQNKIRNIDLNTVRYISDNNYGEISTIDKKVEN